MRLASFKLQGKTIHVALYAILLMGNKKPFVTLVCVYFTNDSSQLEASIIVSIVFEEKGGIKIFR